MGFWEAHGKRQDASHCFPMSACENKRQRVYKEVAKFKPNLSAYDASQPLVTDECRFLNQRVQGSNPCAPTIKIKDLDEKPKARKFLVSVSSVLFGREAIGR